MKSEFANCARRGESGASSAAKRFEQQRQRHLLQQVPLRQFDDCSCYAAKMMTMATMIPTYDCPCGVPDSAAADTVAQIPPPPPPLLIPVVGGGGTATCDVCGRALSATCSGGDESRCRCARVWESPYSRLPVSETGSHVTCVSTTATGSRRRVASPRPSDVTTPLDDVRHVTMTSSVGDFGCALTSTRRDDATNLRVTNTTA